MKVSDLVWAIAPALGIVLIIWLMSYGFSKAVRDYEIIKPKEGISCVVVSRMFNTSVDCWRDNQ